MRALLDFDTTATGFESGDLHLLSVRGFETISQLYEFEIELECRLDGGIAPESIAELLSSTSVIAFGPGGATRISGLVRELELREMEPEGRRSFYRAVLVPRLHVAKLTRRSRCFNELSFLDIAREVLSELGFVEDSDFEILADGAGYPVREYVVQYEETDFAFLSRWMERLGLFYFFEQTDEGDRLIIADDHRQLLAVAENDQLRHRSHGETAEPGEVCRMRSVHRATSSTVIARDYNWRFQAELVSGSAEINPSHGLGLLAYHGDHLGTDAEAQTRAQRRAEAQIAAARRCSGITVNSEFAPGRRFTVSGAPTGDLDGEYVITRVLHAISRGRAGQAASYQNEFEALPLEVQYRSPRIVPWPRIDGVIHAKIDAEAVSTAAPVDDRGRYRVVLPYDLYAGYGGRATRWIRKAEPYAGPAYGMHFSLHVGTEVLLAHIQGDPDRPVIIGAVPNDRTGSPLTAHHATRSAISTRSGILIDFEDDA